MSDIKKDKTDITSKRTDSNLTSNFNMFFKNECHSFVVLKAEKLASAVYMVSGFVSENDPLRAKLRTCALDLVSYVVDGRRGGSLGGPDGFAARSVEIGAMLGMAERAGLISPMNAKVLSEEYAELASFVHGNTDQIFGAGSFDISAEVPRTNQFKISPPKGHSSVTIAKPASKKTPNYKRHQNRRDIILSLLNKKDKITVKDASATIEGCSEKTIQRELTAMVAEGVLLKEGDRRWSTYKKAS